MRKRLKARCFLVGGLLAGVALLTPATPAQAECLYAMVYVSRSQTEPVYVFGPDPCVQATPWNQVVFVGPSYITLTNLPPGVPNGYYAEVRVPVP